MNRISRQLKLFSLVFVVMAVVIIGSAFFFLNRNTKYEPKQVTYQFFAGEKMEYGADAQFILKEYNSSVVESDESEEILDSPIYYSESEKLTLPVAYAYYNPRLLECYRLDAYSEVGIQNDNLAISISGREKLSTGGFLFDGKGIYVCLEPMTFKLNGTTIELGRFSYVMVAGNGFVNYYDYATQSGNMEQIYTEELVLSSYDYEIDLKAQVLSDIYGNSQLLVSNPEILDPYVYRVEVRE